MKRSSTLLTLALAATPTFALAQQQTPAKPVAQPPAISEDGEDGPDIVVRGARPPGSVIGDIPPEKTLSPADIRSYGVGSITDLLTELAPQIRSDSGGGGQPVILLDGKRISSFSEIRDLPTEAIARVEILPEEVALKYGYRADQKVVNFVLRRRFLATTVELSDQAATAGGRNNPQAELDLLKIARSRRINLHLEYQAQSALTEDERSIISSPSNFSIPGNIVGTVAGGPVSPALGTATIAGVPNANPTLADFIGTAGTRSVTDPGQYRTLQGSSRTFNANATYARSFGNVSATFNGTLNATRNDGLNGLPTVALTLPAGNRFSPFANAVVVNRGLSGDFGPLNQRSSSTAAHFGTSFNGSFGKWQWSLTGNYDRNDSETFTDTGVDANAFQARLNANDPTANPFGPLRAGDIAPLASNSGFSTTNSAGVDALINGTLFALPAGSVSTSVRVGGDINDFSSRSFRGGLTSSVAVRRNTGNGQINLDVPLTSRSKDVLGAIGNLSVNGNFAVDHLSDFGTLTTIGYGLNWSPVVPLRIIASVTERDTAPSQQNLGNPQVLTPNVRVFDLVRGENAIVTSLSGGNPGLLKSSSHTVRLSGTFKPWSATDFSLQANYVEVRVDNPVNRFPNVSAAIEAAFPGRFTRDAPIAGDPRPGQLLRIDTRPINFARTSRSELRWGMNFSTPLKSKIQKQLEAFRAGKGPNPYVGVPVPPGVARQIAEARAEAQARGGGAPGSAAGQPRGGTPGGGAPGAGAGGPGGGGGGRGGFGGGGFGGGGGGFGGGGGGRGGGGGGGAGGGGRLNFALYHTWHFTDRVLVQQGGPALDLLRGDAVNNDSGQPRHELEGQAGYSNNGIGLRLSTNWQSATRVNGGTVGNPTSLRFSGLATANLRLFADLGQRLDLVKKHPWLIGTRIALSVDNVADTRQRVTDANGITPIAYQPGYRNPVGRTVRLTVRKLFL